MDTCLDQQFHIFGLHHGVLVIGLEIKHIFYRDEPDLIPVPGLYPLQIIAGRLLDRDIEKSKSMMEDLIHYLRTSLSKTRQDNTTIGQEMEMIRAYLNIFKVRMEDRLKYTIDIPGRISRLRFPPMLIQPLVENAIKHGLEPKIEGGEIVISGEVKGNILRLEITDTGLGLHGNGNSGFGLSNIEERLRSLFGEKGRLIFEENRPSGMKAVIEVPYDRD